MDKSLREQVIIARNDELVRIKIITAFEPLMKKCIGIYLRDKTYYEDAMQEARLAVMKCISRYDENSRIPFEAYVKRGVIYCIRDFAYKIKECISLDEEINEDGGCLHDILDSGVDIEGEEVRKEDAWRLREAMEKLPENYRNILRKYYVEKMSLTEICGERRCHYMTVVKLKERALKRLRELMEEQN